MALDRTLHHATLDPFSRTVRLALGEKRLGFAEQPVRYWDRPDALRALNPSGLPPVLVDGRGRDAVTVCETRAILEHLEERWPDPPLLPADPAARAEARRLLGWFERKFDYEVNGLLLHEKMEKRLLGLGAPELAALRAGREALRAHLAVMEALLSQRHWLAGADLTLADLSAAAHLSVIDYMGEAPWDEAPNVRAWYARIKSRPAFRPLLADRQPGIAPAAHYDDLDF
jgi:glutathione S-transferase